MRSPSSENSPPGLLDFMKRPGSWPDPPQQIRHVQTHASHVFIGSSRVYKIKKAVDYGFLDYSTLEKRRHFCHREVELNRRLSEGVYLGVVAICRRDDGTLFFGPLREESGETEEGVGAERDPDLPREEGQHEPQETESAAGSGGSGAVDGGEVVEYAVVMNRLEEGHFLLDYLRSGTLSEEHLEQVARKLARFYRSLEPDDQVLEYGRPENIWFNTEENFRQTEPFIGRTIDRISFGAIRHFAGRCLEVNRDRFRRRIDRRRIVEGHGDLHLEHIHWSDGTVQIYDCIEFNRRFRYIDLAADLAFLAMDLDFHGCSALERFFIRRMAERLEDGELTEILDFYKCYRAWVRGKVKSLQSREKEVPERERAEAAETARRYFRLALSYALVGSKPGVLAVMGPIASGKSTLARELSERLDLPLFSSDRIRKELSGLPLHERTPEAMRGEVYSPAITGRTYRELLERAAERLEAGSSVIVDATFGDPQHRSRLLEALELQKRTALFIEAYAPEDTIRRRLEGREGDGKVVSDARAEDYENLMKRYRPPAEIREHRLIRVDTGREREETVEQLCRMLAGRNAERGLFS